MQLLTRMEVRNESLQRKLKNHHQKQHARPRRSVGGSFSNSFIYLENHIKNILYDYK
jgi:hypothetical protein